jgi:hypothetical protein
LSYGEGVTIEIKTPALEALIHERLSNGTFHDVDELLTKALESLPATAPPRRKTRAEAIAHIRQSREGNHLPPGVTVKDLINEGRA